MLRLRAGRGKSGVPHARRLVFGLRQQRLDAHAAASGRHALATNRRAPRFEQVAQHPAPGKGILQMQLIHAALQRKSAGDVGFGV